MHNPNLMLLGCATDVLIYEQTFTCSNSTAKRQMKRAMRLWHSAKIPFCLIDYSSFFGSRDAKLSTISNFWH